MASWDIHFGNTALSKSSDITSHQVSRVKVIADLCVGRLTNLPFVLAPSTAH